MTVTQELLTAEQFRLLPDSGKPCELVRGKVIEMSLPAPKHGYYCSNVAMALGTHVKARRLGRVVINDSAIITGRGPDSVRGADVAYYSYQRLPPGPLPEGYVEVAPELVVEVRSPTDRWARINAKVGEYMDASVLVVCVLDPETGTLIVHQADELTRVLEAEDEFTLPNLLGDFRTPVRSFLE